HALAHLRVDDRPDRPRREPHRARPASVPHRLPAPRGISLSALLRRRARAGPPRAPCPRGRAARPARRGPRRGRRAHHAPGRGDAPRHADRGRHGCARVRRGDARIEAYPRVKDQTDLELAIAAARKAGADEVVIVAAFGGRRLDHEIANVLLLAEGPRVSAVRGGTTMRVIRDGERIALEGET